MGNETLTFRLVNVRKITVKLYSISSRQQQAYQEDIVQNYCYMMKVLFVQDEREMKIKTKGRIGVRREVLHVCLKDNIVMMILPESV